MKHEKTIDPIPQIFDSAEAAGDFWDTHDTMDYPDVFEDVEVNAVRRHRFYEVAIEDDVAAVLRDKAQQQGISASDLATRLLRQQLVAV